MFRLAYDNAGGRTMGNAMQVPVTAGEEYCIGEALVINSGKATKCGATAKPTHMCVRDQAADREENVLVYPISSTMVFETRFTEVPTSVNVGDKVTVANDGLGITATTDGGVCEIVDILDMTVSGRALVKF